MLIFSKLDIEEDRDRENDESNLSTRPIGFEFVELVIENLRLDMQSYVAWRSGLMNCYIVCILIYTYC